MLLFFLFYDLIWKMSFEFEARISTFVLQCAYVCAQYVIYSFVCLFFFTQYLLRINACKQRRIRRENIFIFVFVLSLLVGRYNYNTFFFEGFALCQI